MAFVLLTGRMMVARLSPARKTRHTLAQPLSSPLRRRDRLDIAAKLRRRYLSMAYLPESRLQTGLVNMRLPDAFIAEMAQMQAASLDLALPDGVRGRFTKLYTRHAKRKKARPKCQTSGKSC
jgi:hypothetical protein